MVANVPPGQVGLKATAPDSPLSSVLVAVNDASRKADTAYRRGEELRREVAEYARRLADTEVGVAEVGQIETLAGKTLTLQGEVRTLKKQQVENARRINELMTFANDAMVMAEKTAATTQSLSDSLTRAFQRQADETSELKAQLAALGRKKKLTEAKNV